MWPFKPKKTRQRRVDPRKGATGPRWVLLRRIRDEGGLGVLLLAAIFYAAVALMDVWPADPLPYRVGQYIPRDIYARVRLKIPDAALLQKEKREAEESTPVTFRLDEEFLQNIAKNLRSLPDSTLKTATQPSEIPAPTTQEFAIESEADFRAWRSTSQPAQRRRFENDVTQLTERLAQKPIIKYDQLAQLGRKANAVYLQRPAGRVRMPLDALINVSETARIANILSQEFQPSLRKGVRNFLQKKLAEQPVYIYDAEASRLDVQQRLRELEANPPERTFEVYDAEGVGSPARVLVFATRNKGLDRRAGRGLSTAERDLLAREHAAYIRSLDNGRPHRKWLRAAGRAGVVALIVLLLSLYVAAYRPEVVRSFWRALAVAMLLVILLAINKAIVMTPLLSVYAAVLVVVMASMILCIAYGQRFGLAMGVFLSLLAVLQFRGDFSLLVVLLLCPAVCVFQLSEIRTRSKLVMVSAVTAAVVFAVIAALDLTRSMPWRFVLIDAVWGAGAALLGGFIVQGILPLIEIVFRTVTSTTLLEWCDTSKPLLKRLAMEAPGTFNHSLQLGSICESAAEAIGANGLLARVGAYYHDIGKMNKPAYFIENQTSTQSKHSGLSPAMSLLIIIAHVKDGLEMAREYGLPTVLREFIATHHGTTLVQYFYHAAAEQRKADDERAPDEAEFRYPGPKPRSKEAAILMLADASESSVRAMSEPTPGRIENQVHTMVNRRLMDGQLDDCDLTLREVHQIETSIIKSLCSIYHSRIAYPTPAGEKPSAAEMPKPAKPQPAEIPHNPVPPQQQ